MSIIPTLSSYGGQAFHSCLHLYYTTKNKCRTVARQTLEDTLYWSAYLGYKIGSRSILNTVSKLHFGRPLEKTLLNPLHLAALFGTVKDVKDAIGVRTDLNPKDFWGATPLHLSVQARSSEVYKYLVAKGADLEAQDENGFTPLHVAVAKSDVGTAVALLKLGADVNAKTKLGNTPLHLAVKEENKAIIRALVSKGADIYARNANGKTSIDTSPEILRILHNAESHPAFSSKASLTRYFDKLFPPSRERLTKNLAWLEQMKNQLDGGKNPFEELENLFARRGTAAFDKDANAMQILKAVALAETPHSPSTPLPKILDYLFQYSPHLVKAYELASREKKWGVYEADMPWVAMFSHYEHAIWINNKNNIQQKAHFIIFETLNALQNERYKKLHNLAEQGALSRETFALLKEYCEYDTCLWCSRIVGDKAIPNFEETWKFLNSPKSCFGPLAPTHADVYRQQWDLLYGFTYLKKHPRILKRA
jgi:Ankyrin repeats (3 copies)/Ankyrin repeat